jgi:hypothetical protein
MTQEPHAQDRRTNQDRRSERGPVVRQARLRASYAGLYPSITPGVWIPAAEVGAVILFRRLAEEGRVTPGSRLLEEEHFEFRGGWSRGAEPLRTRAIDVEEEELEGGAAF